MCDRTVTQVPFKGCIKEVQLGTLAKDLNENKEFKDVSPGCTEVSLSSRTLMRVSLYQTIGLTGYIGPLTLTLNLTLTIIR